jgi:galactokinase
MSPHTRVREEFIKRFGEPPVSIVRAPGRVNLIGEHTDYNDGFVMPMAINRAMWIALRPRQDSRVVLHSLEFPRPTDFSLKDIQHGEGWDDYVRGVAWSLLDSGFPLEGWEGVVSSDIPVAAGLSSSAALELAAARAFWSISRWDWNPIQMAKAARKTENQWFGLQSGIMDQMISANGREGHALLIDCRDLSTRLVPLPEGTAVIVMDTATSRGLVDSAYNERVAQCQAAANFFGVTSLREVSLETFEARASDMDELIRRRARHVITENRRTLSAETAMRAGDPVAMGRLMNASHESLRCDYEVSSKELDVMVAVAREQVGCYGARMTGAGFGGCAVALVKEDAASGFAREVASGYLNKTKIKPNVYICQPTNGAELVEG